MPIASALYFSYIIGAGEISTLKKLWGTIAGDLIDWREQTVYESRMNGSSFAIEGHNQEVFLTPCYLSPFAQLGETETYFSSSALLKIPVSQL